MKTLSCPIPDGLDVLQNNGFRFSIAKIPEISFFCQEASLPSMHLIAAVVPTPFVDYHVPGDKLNFGPIQISFLIDSKMKNYVAINEWLVGLGFPQGHEQYQAFLESFGGGLDKSPLAISQSDATLHVLGGTNSVVQTVSFAGVQPVMLSEVRFVTDNNNVVYQTATAQFAYSYYYFKKKD